MTKKQFKWNAEDYAANSVAQQKWATELLSILNLNGDESVLDVGCGDGKITAQISDCVPRGTVIGIDSSSEMITLASNAFPKELFPNLRFELMDARKISFLQQFDVVFSNAALHWVKEHDEVLKGFYNSLKPKGRIVVQMGGQGNAKNILDLFDEIMRTGRWEKYFNNFNFSYSFLGIEEYRNLLSAAGLIENNIILIPKDMQQKGKEGLAGWIRTTWLPYLERIPEENEKENFITEIVDRYIEKFPVDEQGIVHVKMVRLQVEASKP
jgi:trans-aconitate 2-methyltransferase